jgi:hypothetical protein
MKTFLSALLVGVLLFIAAPLARAGYCGGSTVAWDTTELLVTHANAVNLSPEDRARFNALQDEARALHDRWWNVTIIEANKAEYDGDIMRFSSIISQQAQMLRNAGDTTVNVTPVLAALNDNHDWMTPYAAELAQLVLSYPVNAGNWDVQLYQSGVGEVLVQPGVMDPQVNKQAHHLLLLNIAVVLNFGAGQYILDGNTTASPALVAALEQHLPVSDVSVATAAAWPEWLPFLMVAIVGLTILAGVLTALASAAPRQPA